MLCNYLFINFISSLSPLAEALFFKRPPLSVLFFYHCVEFFSGDAEPKREQSLLPVSQNLPSLSDEYYYSPQDISALIHAPSPYMRDHAGVVQDICWMDFCCLGLVPGLRETALPLALKIKAIRAAEAVCAFEVLIATVLESGKKGHLKLVYLNQRPKSDKALICFTFF